MPTATPTRYTCQGDERGMSPLLGVLLLVGLTITLAATVAIGVGSWTIDPVQPTTSFELDVDGDRSTIVITPVAGETITVTDLSLTIEVNEAALSKQPPVPFVGAEGFAGAPRGPFNAASDPTWTIGERAALTVAGTNDPTIASGDSVTVTLAVDGQRVATLEARAT